MLRLAHIQILLEDNPLNRRTSILWLWVSRAILQVHDEMDRLVEVQGLTESIGGATRERQVKN